MNTVLDDNKTLCLANSERIKLPTTLHMMFEVGRSSAQAGRVGPVFSFYFAALASPFHPAVNTHKRFRG